MPRPASKTPSQSRSGRTATQAATRARCAKCGQTKPVSEFPGKRDGHGSYCRECRRAYNREHYRRNAETRRPQLKARKDAKRAELQAVVEQFKRRQRCAECKTRSPLSGWHPDGRTPSSMVRSERPLDELRAALAEMQWRCRPCWGSRFGSMPSPAEGRLDTCLVDACRGRERSVTELVAMASAQRPTTTRASVQSTLTGLVHSGELVRVRRGVYTVP